MPKTKLNKPENPFSAPDSTQVWFEQDKDYMLLKRISKNNFYKSNHLQSSFNMTLQNTIFKTFNYFSKHLLITALLGVLLLGSVSAAAAQIFAPDEYKPLTLLHITKPQGTSKNNNPVKEQTQAVPDAPKTNETPTEAIQPASTVKDTPTQTRLTVASPNGSTQLGLNIRKEPCGDVLGIQIWGASGKIASSSPIEKECQGQKYSWLQVDWEDGRSGWSITDNLKEISSLPTQVSIYLEGPYCRQNATDPVPDYKTGNSCQIKNTLTKQVLNSIKSSSPITTFKFGKKTKTSQFIANYWASGFQGNMTIYQFNFADNSVVSLGSYSASGCAEDSTLGPICNAQDKTNNQIYEQAGKLYMAI